MEALLEHLQANYIAYIVIGICALPLLYLTRKYSVPAILYTIEILIYAALLHGAVNLIVRIAVWFKVSSSFRNAFDKEVSEAPPWTTPLLEPWAKELYDPAWVFWFEVIAAILIIAAVLRYRPMKIHKGRQRKFDDRGKKIGPSARGARPGARPPQPYANYKK